MALRPGAWLIPLLPAVAAISDRVCRPQHSSAEAEVLAVAVRPEP